jgi:NADH-quinone oxidoreductase subunit I
MFTKKNSRILVEDYSASSAAFLCDLSGYRFSEWVPQNPRVNCHLQRFQFAWYSTLVMGMPSLLRKIFLVDLLQGLKVTFRYQDPKEIYTEQYPLERPQVAERYRGAPRLNVNPDTDETMCIACDLCALACPEHLIVVSSERNEKTRRKELTNFTYDLSRCMFCGLCEDACPTDALELTQDFELASYTRQGWIWDRETLEKGPQPTQYKK